MNLQCPFCSIVSGNASASIIYENGNLLVFMDLNPANIGHTLIVPRKHWENIYEIPEKYVWQKICEKFFEIDKFKNAVFLIFRSIIDSSKNEYIFP